jgi:hypothetical protein
MTDQPNPVGLKKEISGHPTDHSRKALDFCDEHGTTKMWANCGNCFEGFTSHDCGEDCCCCLDPEDNVVCDICLGEGGFMLCPVCAPNADF